MYTQNIERAISTDYYTLFPDEHPPPKGVEILLITKGGKLVIGKWNDADCVEWAPLPKRSRRVPIMLDAHKELFAKIETMEFPNKNLEILLANTKPKTAVDLDKILKPQSLTNIKINLWERARDNLSKYKETHPDIDISADLSKLETLIENAKLKGN